MRRLEDSIDLDQNGFQLVKYSWRELDLDNEEATKKTVFAETAELMKQMCVVGDRDDCGRRNVH